MRTTLDIDPDVMLAAKDLAARKHTTAGHVLSELARQALTSRRTRGERNGVPLFPTKKGGTVVTLELVNRLRDAAP